MEYEVIHPQRVKIILCARCGKWEMAIRVKETEVNVWVGGEPCEGWLNTTCGYFTALGDERGAGGYRVLSEGH